MMTKHRRNAILLALPIGALVGAGFGVMLSTRDWDATPRLGSHQPLIGGILMGTLVAALVGCARPLSATRDK